MLDPIPLTIVWADKARLRIAGGLRAMTAEAGLSHRDRFCLPLALRDGPPACTSDQSWKRVADAAKVKLITIR